MRIIILLDQRYFDEDAAKQIRGFMPELLTLIIEFPKTDYSMFKIVNIKS